MKYLVVFISTFLISSISAQPDVIETNDGNVTLTPILHATMVLEWNDVTLYIDPYGGADRFDRFDAADVVVITHAHGDHLNQETLAGLDLSETTLVAPQSVVDALGDITFGTVMSLDNGSSWTFQEIEIEAVPMYNLPNDETARHKKGWGNGYVITIGGKRFYISGDTEDIPEMRALEHIDYAFVCMNLPYTMDVDAAADAVLDFAPAVVYPFHFRGGGGTFSDVGAFKKIVNEGNGDIEVRLRDWYPE